MKKSFFFVAALALTFVACNNNEPEYDAKVASFENLELAEESVLHLSQTGTFTSGNFTFQQEVADYGEWGVYYFGNIATNKTSKEYKGDTQNDMSASGGAHKGKNFVVWTNSYAGIDGIMLLKDTIVPGFYVNNTPWVVDAIKNGDGMSEEEAGKGLPFGKDDWFKLTITGKKANGDVAGTVDFMLAQGTSYVSNWTYVDLRKLGEVHELRFTLTSTKHNTAGMTTPAYFALDDLGAKY